MSIFGRRMIGASILWEREFGDDWQYQPMKEVVNGEHAGTHYPHSA
jgi:hypothetical protein